MPLVQCRKAGRVFLVCPRGPLGAPETSPERLIERARASNARAVLLDMTRAPYIDSDGLRWLLDLKRATAAAATANTEEAAAPPSPPQLRVAARRNGAVWRNLKLLDTGIATFASLRDAWHAPLPGARRPCPKQ